MASELCARRRRLFAFVLGGLLLTGSASAQSLADRETARSLMEDGDSKRDKGDWKGALKSYEAADAIMKVPTTGLEVARAQAQLGLLLEARETLTRVLRIPPKPGEPPPFTQARKSAEAMSSELAARIPSIQVAVTGLSPGQTPDVRVDGEQIPPAAIQAPRKVNPGNHTVTVRVGAIEKKADVVVLERETKQVSFDLKDEAPPPTTTAPPPVEPPTDPTADGGGGARKVLIFGGFGLGIVGIGVGSVTGLMSLSKTNDLKSVCPDNNCPADKQSEIDSATTLGNISTVAFIVGGVGIAAGVVGLVMPSSGAAKVETAESKRPASAFEPTNVRAVLGPAYAGVAGAF